VQISPGTALKTSVVFSRSSVTPLPRGPGRPALTDDALREANAGSQRPALAARPLEEDVRRRVVSDIRSRDRRASFTAAELRNTLATSGSKTATFAPSLKMRR